MSLLKDTYAVDFHYPISSGLSSLRRTDQSATMSDGAYIRLMTLFLKYDLGKCGR
jgi:hypothetical protein